MFRNVNESIAVIGHPISHSLSPDIHGAAFDHLRIQAEYSRIDVPQQNVASTIQQMRAGHFRQFAVTIPNKEIALREANSASDVATHIGAANTLTRMSDGTIVADNTDWIGVRDSLLDLEDWRGKSVLVLGAGGAARGAIHALQQLGATIFISNRTQSKAQELARHFDLRLGSERGDYDLIINTTSVGLHMNDAPDNELNTPIEKSNLRRGMTVFDTVMNPLTTRLLRDADTAGCRTIDGLRMLIYQGIEQLRIWTGVVDPALSQTVVSNKEELARIMRQAALKKLGLMDTTSS